ncbi:MAG: signal peptidase I [Elainellaceae cyanobacterium]
MASDPRLIDSQSPENSPTVEQPSSRIQPEKERSAWSRWWLSQRDNIQLVTIALVLALFIRVFIAEPRYIPSDSMAPTLEVGDRLVVEKVSYYFRPPTAGEIVVFDPPPQLQSQGYSANQAFIKRVIGEPGQVVAVRGGVVFLDGQPVPESYIAEPPHYELLPVKIPDGFFFVMGDNRNNSNDSHLWGFLPRENVIGHAIFRFWPPQRIDPIQHPIYGSQHT